MEEPEKEERSTPKTHLTPERERTESNSYSSHLNKRTVTQVKHMMIWEITGRRECLMTRLTRRDRATFRIIYKFSNYRI